MDQRRAYELHDLLFNFVGLFHEKFLYGFRRQNAGFMGLKKNQFKILGRLSCHHSLTSTEIGRMLDLEKGSVTTLIDQLEEYGLVVRGYDPDDRRKFQIVLSDAGREAVNTINAGHVEGLGALLHGVDEREVDRFFECLQYSVAFMKKL
ncbi:MAG: MarR family transcriptional regulator [Firmicutes bacterium]|nr:MarR family transcriptional regulator [Bacillota bacterium]